MENCFSRSIYDDLFTIIPFYEKYIIQNIWEINDNLLFQELLQTKNNLFMILGESIVGKLNSTHINKIISE
jgi:hypothetical protein